MGKTRSKRVPYRAGRARKQLLRYISPDNNRIDWIEERIQRGVTLSNEPPKAKSGVFLKVPLSDIYAFQKEIVVPWDDPSDSPPPYQFPMSLYELARAVTNDESTGEFNIAEQLLDPNFKFSTTDDELFSRYLSAFIPALLSKHKAILGREAALKSSATRTANADEYATSMFDTVQKLKTETNVKTYQATIAMLTEKKIPTPNGGKWRINTLQDLEKRWQKLGLIPEKKRQPK